MATWELREQMNATSAPVGTDVSEFELANLQTEPSKLVKPPRVKATPVHLECVLFKIVDMPSTSSEYRHAMVIGQVIGVHINDQFLKDGIVDIERIMPLARMGYKDYTHVERVYPMDRPKP